jgi:oligopeptide transport system substrate-binding protein
MDLGKVNRPAPPARPLMDKTLPSVLGCFAVALAAVGFTFTRSVDAPATFRFVNGTEPKTLDPGRMTGQPEGRIADAIFEGLTRYDAKTHSPAPGAAESWDVSPDGKTYTFHIRADARWTDGHPVTAHDFSYSWRRLVDPKLGSEYGYILFPIRYAEAMNAYAAHAETIDRTIVPKLGELRKQSPTGVTARALQRFLSDHHAHDALRGATDPAITALLGRNDGSATPGELAAFQDAAGRLSGKLREAARDATAHFGIDGGAYAKDDRTLVVELRAPTPYFLEITSFHTCLPVPRWLTEDEKRKNDWFLPEHVVSNGPFRLKSWFVNDHIRLERSETYWGKNDVRMNAVDALSLEGASTALNLFLTGEIDWLPQMYPSDLVDVLKTRPDFYKNPGLIVYYYRFNTTRRPFDDRRVRQALNLAVDRRVIVDTVLGLGQIPASTFVPPGMAGYQSPESSIKLDLARARGLLAEAGYPDGKGLPDVGILYNTFETHKKIAEIVADQLKRGLGIRVNAYNQEWQSFIDTTRNLDYDMARAGWIGDYVDPNTFLDMFVTNGGNNQTGWSSPLYDRLIDAAADVSKFAENPGTLLGNLKEPAPIRRLLETVRGQSAPEERLRATAAVRMLLLREAESILINDEFPILPVYFYVASGLVQPRVRGFYPWLVFDDGTTAPNLQDNHPLRDIWVDPGSPVR